MNLDEYTMLDATGLAEHIAKGDITAAEAHALALEAIAKVNPDINACAAAPFAEPLAYSESGPYAGVPFGLKDLICYAKGVPTKWGSRMSGTGVVFDHDTTLMSKFREAGLATTVLTTTPENGYGGNTEPLISGSTRNPWDLSKSVGGSSGGSGAIVAAGAVPLAHGNDAGGSIRIPSSYNGTVGLKPGRGIVSLGPAHAEGVTGLASEFVLTRSVRDVAGVLDQVAGWVPGERYRLAAPPASYTSALTAEPAGLRIAMHTESWAGSHVDPEVAAAVEATALQLERIGHHVEVATPVFDWDQFMIAERVFWIQFGTDCVAALSALTGKEPTPENLEACNWNAYQAGMKMTARQMSEALAIQNQTSRSAGAFFTDYDILLTPTTNTTALPLGTLDHNDPTIDADGWCDLFHEKLSFTPFYNQTGLPAISLPLAESSSGMPIGIQLGADMGNESLLIAVASQLEQAMPWTDRKPSIHASR